jgi:hypothetical protein
MLEVYSCWFRKVTDRHISEKKRLCAVFNLRKDLEP